MPLEQSVNYPNVQDRVAAQDSPLLQWASAQLVSGTGRKIIWVPAGTSAAQINAWSLQASLQGQTTLVFEPSQYVVDRTIIHYSNVQYEYNWAELFLANGTNTSVVESASFAAGTGVASSTIDYMVNIHRLLVNGNKANQTSGNGLGVALYTQVSRLDGLMAHDCRGPGLWTERNNTPTNFAGGLQYVTNCFYRNILLYNNGTNDAGTMTGKLAPAIDNYNAASVSAEWVALAEDDIADGVFIWSSGSVAVGQRALLTGYSAANAGGQGSGCLQLTNSHLWLNHDIQVDFNGNPNYSATSQFEGGNINILLRAAGTVIAAVRDYLSFANGTLLKIDGASVIMLKGQFSNVGNGGTFVNFAANGTFSDITAMCLQPSGTVTLVAGAVPATTAALILNAGGGGTITGASVRTLGAG